MTAETTLPAIPWNGRGPTFDDESTAVQAPTIIQRTGALSLSDVPTDPPGPLLRGRLAPGDHTILFGTGGVGKGTYTTALIAGLAADGHRVLILDYENHGDEWARRYHGLAGTSGMDAVLWVAPLAASWTGRRGALWEQEADVNALAVDFGATYIVIDSIVPACAGHDPMDTATVSRYGAVLEYLGLPVLSLAHVTKAEDLRYPFGSVFWHNLARITWSMAKDGPRVILTHRKANSYQNAGRIAVTTTWLDDLPREVREEPYSAVIADRIEEILSVPMTVAAIVAGLNEDVEEDARPVKSNTVRTALRRGLAAIPRRFAVAGTGDTATWSKP